ncbi:MAG: tetratricopeptide repeat protein [Candidatus Velthaea sp.]
MFLETQGFMSIESMGRKADRSLPSGTVTFLFSDIEGSTQRWEARPVQMQAALRRHDALVRAAIETHGGHVFKSMGDQFCAAFARTADAIAAAFDAQRALAAEDWSDVDGLNVRMALHHGAADERDGDYFGTTLNKVARILSVAHGGQVLASSIVADLAQSVLPPGGTLADLGPHRLKDLAQPERIFQLTAPGLRADFPPLRSLDALPNNLPRQISSFVGRDADIAEIKKQLDKTPVLTLVGAGGVGKTRCALQAGTELLQAYADGVWFVDFAPLGDPALVPHAIASALGVHESPNRALVETIVGFLRNRQALVILDNCEHVVVQAAHCAEAIVRACTHVRIVATSREPLGIGGERTYRVPSLSVPPRGAAAGLTAAEALSYGAIALFVERAEAVESRFRLTDAAAPIVAGICARLDGIALAIELAAARVNVLALPEIAEKLNERFWILTGGSRTALPRQQTLRALIDWSYDLLAAAERAVFRRLAVFAGSFALERAGAICADDALEASAVFDILASLVDKSLVQAERDAAGGTRYRLLESTRRYACEKLTDCGELTAVGRRHAEAMAALAERLHAAWETMPEQTWLAQTQPELENWRAALEWALEQRGDVRIGQRLAGALQRVWGSAASEGRRWARAALETTDESTPLLIRVRLHVTEATADAKLVQYKASLAAGQQALALCADIDDPLEFANALLVTARALLFTGSVSEGEALFERALDAARRHGARRLASFALEGLAVVRSSSGDLRAARALFAEALALLKTTGAQGRVATIAANLAEVEFRGGHPETALLLGREAIAACRERNDRHGLASTLTNVAAYHVALSRFDEARAHGREALTVARELQLAVLVASALQHVAAVAALQPAGDGAERAAQLLGYVDARLAELGAAREYTEQQEYDRMCAALRTACGEAELERLVAGGRGWSETEALFEAGRV